MNFCKDYDQHMMMAWWKAMCYENPNTYANRNETKFEITCIRWMLHLSQHTHNAHCTYNHNAKLQRVLMFFKIRQPPISTMLASSMNS